MKLLKKQAWDQNWTIVHKQVLDKIGRSAWHNIRMQLELQVTNRVWNRVLRHIWRLLNEIT